MNTLITLVISLFYLGSMAELVSAGLRSADRYRLLAAALAVLFTLVAARAVLPAQTLVTWCWVSGVALYGAALGLAIVRGLSLPWVGEGTSRWSIAGSTVWVAVLLVLTGAALWSFL